MDFLMPTAASEAAAMKLVAEHQAGGGTSHAAADGVVQVSFNRPLDATYHDEMMTVLRSSIENSAGIRVLVVNLKDVSFLDSRAVGGLIRAWKMMIAKGGEMYYAAASPAVAEILRLLRMDQVLKEWKGVPL
jgi:anti-anti-sigma factor